MAYRDFINGMRKEWTGSKVRYEGKEYTVTDVDYNGGLLLNKKAEFTDTTSVPATSVERIA